MANNSGLMPFQEMLSSFNSRSKVFRILLRNCSKSGNNKSESDKNNKDDKNNKEGEKQKDSLPEIPTTCCMSGCANCVWIEFAEKMSNYYKDGGEKAIKEINERFDDPSLKAFLIQEIKMRTKK